MLTMVQDCLPHENGNGWKLPTFHNLMHIVSDMCKYGKPKEANTEVGEKNHEAFTVYWEPLPKATQNFCQVSCWTFS